MDPVLGRGPVAFAAEFAGKSWLPHLRAASWDAKDHTLQTEVDDTFAYTQTDVLAMCTDLSAHVRNNSPANTGSIFIVDTEGDITATNFLANADRCYWRGG
jgi:hypothetical protein